MHAQHDMFISSCNIERICQTVSDLVIVRMANAIPSSALWHACVPQVFAIATMFTWWQICIIAQAAALNELFLKLHALLIEHLCHTHSSLAMIYLVTFM